MSDDETLFGKKVFFLNPPGVLSDVAAILGANELEVYLVYDHKKLARYLKKNPNALVFVNLDEGMPEPEWEAWIHSLMKDPATSSVGIGVVTMLSDTELSRKYLMDIGLPCGFIVLKIGAAKTTEILLKTLEANEARGRRKYVRAACPAGTAEFNAPSEDNPLRGIIQNISSVGMAASVDARESLPVGSRLKDLQLSLRGVRIFVNGIVVGKRKDNEQDSVRVILFEPASLTDEKKTKIQAYAYRVLQDDVNRQLELA
jgi:hypothetical protein